MKQTQEEIFDRYQAKKAKSYGITPEMHTQIKEELRSRAFSIGMDIDTNTNWTIYTPPEIANKLKTDSEASIHLKKWSCNCIEVKSMPKRSWWTIFKMKWYIFFH